MATKDFISYIPTQGSKNSNVDITALKNTGVARQTSVSVAGSGCTKTVSINQDEASILGFECFFKFDINNLTDFVYRKQGAFTIASANCRGSQMIKGNTSIFIIRNYLSIPDVTWRIPTIDNISIVWENNSRSYIKDLGTFTTEIVPNSENEGGVLSLIDIDSTTIASIGEAFVNCIREGGAVAITISSQQHEGQNILYIISIT